MKSLGVLHKRSIAIPHILEHLFLHPFSRNPAVDHLKTGDRLVVGNHVSTSVESDKGEVTAALDGANLGVIFEKGKILHRSIAIGLLARPVKSSRPSKVAEPVADEISVTLYCVSIR